MNLFLFKTYKPIGKKRLEEYTPKYLQRCKSQFPQTQNKVANSVHLIGWLWTLNLTIYWTTEHVLSENISGNAQNDLLGRGLALPKNDKWQI